MDTFLRVYCLYEEFRLKVCETQRIESASAIAANRNPAVSGYVGV
jgi:hypothetical protein